MRQLSSIVVLVFFTLPVWAQETNHKWVKSGSDGDFRGCVDINSIVKNKDGSIQYLHALCAGADDQIDDIVISSVKVNCKEKMSGKNIVTKQAFYKKDGDYQWAKRKEVNTDNRSLIAQSVKFACSQ